MPAKKYHIDLTEMETSKLESIATKRKSTSEIVKRSKILLAADRNGPRQWGDAEISSQYEVSSRTIERLRKRYVEESGLFHSSKLTINPRSLATILVA